MIRSVRAHIGEIGVIDEARVLAGELDYTMDVVRQGEDGQEALEKVAMQRLEPSSEAIVLRAMHQMFVDHGICVREALDGGGRELILEGHARVDPSNRLSSTASPLRPLAFNVGGTAPFPQRSR